MSSGGSELAAVMTGMCDTAEVLSQRKFVQQTIVVNGNASDSRHIIGTDSTAAIGILRMKGSRRRTKYVEVNGSSERTKHVEVKVSSSQHHVSKPHVKVTKVGTKEMVADRHTRVITINSNHAHLCELRALDF